MQKAINFNGVVNFSVKENDHRIYFLYISNIERKN